MKENKDFGVVVEMILKDDQRYDKGAYYFVRQGLDHTLRTLQEKPEGEMRHVTGQELLEGIRDYAHEQYGPMAFTLLDHWGVRKCDDFGDIVFNLVDYGVFGKTDSDKKEDFSGGYDFREAFLRPYLPKDSKGELHPEQS